MRQEKFKMERQGLINVGDEIEISEYQSFMNYSYIIEHTPRGFIVTAEFDE